MPGTNCTPNALAKPPIDMVFQFVSAKVKDSILAPLKEKDGFEFAFIEQALEMFENVDDALKKRFVDRVMTKLEDNGTMYGSITAKSPSTDLELN